MKESDNYTNRERDSELSSRQATKLISPHSKVACMFLQAKIFQRLDSSINYLTAILVFSHAMKMTLGAKKYLKSTITSLIIWESTLGKGHSYAHCQDASKLSIKLETRKSILTAINKICSHAKYAAITSQKMKWSLTLSSLTIIKNWGCLKEVYNYE